MTCTAFILTAISFYVLGVMAGRNKHNFEEE